MLGSEVKEFPVEKEYLKNKEIKPEDIKKFRQWLNSQGHLPSEYITDLDLILTYHCCNRSLEVSKQVLDLHYTFNTLFTAYFKDRKVDDKIILCLKTVLFTILPTPSLDGGTILYIRVLDVDPKNFDFPSWIRTTFMVIDLYQYVQGTWPGLLLVLDYVGVTVRHITKVDITNLRQTIYYLQEVMFLKIKGLHFMNAPSFIDMLLVMMKPLMKKELLEVFHVHTVGSSTIEKYLSKESLPKEAGGNYKTFAECRDETIAFMKSGEKYFEYENKKRVNESLRAGKPKTISDIFGGVEGSFKKLEID